MMLYPPVAELVDKIGSRYQLVNLVAKRARELSAEAEEEEMPLERKAVSSAIDEVYTGKLSLNRGSVPVWLRQLQKSRSQPRHIGWTSRMTI